MNDEQHIQSEASSFSDERFSELNRQKRKEVGECIRNARIAANLSCRQLSALTGIHYNQICRIEAGRTNPSIDTLNTLGSVLGLIIEITPV